MAIGDARRPCPGRRPAAAGDRRWRERRTPGVNDTHLSELLAEAEGIVLSRSTRAAAAAGGRPGTPAPPPSARPPPAAGAQSPSRDAAATRCQSPCLAGGAGATLAPGGGHRRCHGHGAGGGLSRAGGRRGLLDGAASGGDARSACRRRSTTTGTASSSSAPGAGERWRSNWPGNGSRPRWDGPCASWGSPRSCPLAAGQGAHRAPLRHASGSVGGRVAPRRGDDAGGGQCGPGRLSAPLQRPLRRARRRRRSRPGGRWRRRRDPWQICCLRYVRTVGRDDTVRLGEHRLQLLPPRGHGT